MPEVAQQASFALLGMVIDDLAHLTEVRPPRSRSAEHLRAAVALLIDAARAIAAEDGPEARR